jgi:hypothetical protein
MMMFGETEDGLKRKAADGGLSEVRSTGTKEEEKQKARNKLKQQPKKHGEQQQ